MNFEDRPNELNLTLYLFLLLEDGDQMTIDDIRK